VVNGLTSEAENITKAAAMSDGVSVVTTTWNEKENIGKLVAAVRQVLAGTPYEIIVVDDSSSDGTHEIAKCVADQAFSKKREGQTKGLLFGMHYAKYPTIVTIDADLENDPKYIPKMLELAQTCDVVNGSRTEIPRVSERFASATLGRLLGVSDVFSNFRVFRKENISLFQFGGGETFGADFLVIAKRKGLRIGEFRYLPPPRRKSPRIGGTFRANARIFWALVKVGVLYVF
jgi:dolichol-phosphate mannosyltransferase